LDELGTAPVESGVHLPGTIVIGDVVGLRSLPSAELAASAVAFGS